MDAKVLEDYDLNYLGGDIVENLIYKLNLEHSNVKIKFINLDICSDDLPDVDLILLETVCFIYLIMTLKDSFITFKGQILNTYLLPHIKTIIFLKIQILFQDHLEE